MTRYADLEKSDIVKEHLPLLTRALPHIAHAPIRSRGTIGGSVALADPAAEMPALMLTLDATINAVSLAGERKIGAGDFFHGLYETELNPNELIESISIPKCRPDDRHAFAELARRQGDYAMAGVAIAASGSDPVSFARVALFAVSDRPLRARSIEKALVGRSISDEVTVEAAVAELDGTGFHADLNGSADTKRHLARVIIRRALADIGS